MDVVPVRCDAGPRDEEREGESKSNPAAFAVVLDRESRLCLYEMSFEFLWVIWEGS